MQWFARNNVTVMPWPAQSPDLSPIENLWRMLKIRVARMGPHRTPEALTLAAQGVWNNLDPELLHNLIDSMPRRCQAVIDARGYPTSY